MTTDSVQTVMDSFEERLQSRIAELKAFLLTGNLHEFENQLTRQTDDLYNELAQTLMEEAAQTPEIKEKTRKLAQKKGLDQSEKRG